MVYYIGLVHKDKDSAYGVQFPDVPGCYSASDDMDHVIGNATEALSLWAEDAVPPVPRGLEDIIAETDIAADLTAGAFLISVPLIENDGRVVSANISTERGFLKAIDMAARQRKFTRYAFLTQAARNEINR